MPSIDIDFEVFKLLTAQRTSEDVSYNDVIRKYLKLPALDKAKPLASPERGAWTSGGVTFPEGTEFFVQYKGRAYVARVGGGTLIMNGKTYSSLSNAAIAITGTNVNGWNFWSGKLPGELKYRKARDYRKG